MKLRLSTLSMLRRFQLRSFTSKHSFIPALTNSNVQMNNDILNDKNVIISGEFFPTSERLLEEMLLKNNIHLQPQMSPDTEILICGRYPDWMLVEEARIYGVRIIFMDKAGELFSKLASNLNKNKTFSYEEPLGV